MEFIHGQMVRNMMVSGEMESSMEKLNSLIQKARLD
jgi:hypothetical protein